LIVIVDSIVVLSVANLDCGSAKWPNTRVKSVRYILCFRKTWLAKTTHDLLSFVSYISISQQIQLQSLPEKLLVLT